MTGRHAPVTHKSLGAVPHIVDGHRFMFHSLPMLQDEFEQAAKSLTDAFLREGPAGISAAHIERLSDVADAITNRAAEEGQR